MSVSDTAAQVGDDGPRTGPVPVVTGPPVGEVGPGTGVATPLRDGTSSVGLTRLDGEDPAAAAERLLDDVDKELDLDHALVALGTLLLSTPALDEYLDRAAQLAARVFDPPATCGVSLYVDGRPMTVASAGELAGQVEETQYESGDGPCMATMRTGVPIEIPDLSVDERWPDYRAHALSLGLLSTVTMPITDGDRTVGALNLHARTRGAFDVRTRRALELFAAQTSAALELLRRDAEQRTLGEQLRQALASRAVIDQAMGIVMATRRCSAEDAFAFLRRTSQNANRKLRDVATDLVAATAAPRPGRPQVVPRLPSDRA